MTTRLFRIFILSGAAIIGITIYMKFFTHSANETSDRVADVKVGKTYGQASIGGPFSLVDVNGTERTDADYKGKFMIVYFGYSFCPDICPAALYNITQAFEAMNNHELNQFAPLFITVDPERDTVENMKTYMQNFHPRMIGLTGSAQRIESVKKAYRVYAKKAKPDGISTDYLIDHSSIVYVMDRQGRFITSFNHQTDPETIVKTLRAVL